MHTVNTANNADDHTKTTPLSGKTSLVLFTKLELPIFANFTQNDFHCWRCWAMGVCYIH